MVVTSIVLIVSSLTLAAQCISPTDTIAIEAIPPTVEAGQSLYVKSLNTNTWPQAVASRFRAAVDGIPVPILSVGTEGMVVRLPHDVSAGSHTVSVCVVDGAYAELSLNVVLVTDTLDTEVNQYDPDPETQNGSRQDLSSGSRRPNVHSPRTYPNGGFGGSQPCAVRHAIDGAFTAIKGQPTEWSGVVPLIGRFSHLYLDYCPETSMMYLMNDWLIGSGEYQNNCYNLFGFTTGNGREVWTIKVTHDTLNPVIVELNGVDVTDDTTLVEGGAFSIGASPSDTTPHTMYEFGVRVTAGLFFMPEGSDPVTYVPTTTTSLECDKDGVVGYGLIREPYVRLAWFGNDGVTVRQAERYIPTSGVLGLETEPNVITGEYGADTIQYRSGHQSPTTIACNGVSIVDGQISANEWDGVIPASGRYSDIYAKYCNGTLHILNDWVHADAMPDQATCYNLFELFTGNGAEHWGIWVWQDHTKRPTVIRNGQDVSADTTIVKNGKAGWASSSRMSEPHAMYEFTIATMEGGFAMMYADPGPSSFCSLNATDVKHFDDPTNVVSPTLYPNPITAGAALSLGNLMVGDNITITNNLGQIVLTKYCESTPTAKVDLPAHITQGRYSVLVVRNNRTYALHFVVID